MNESLNEAVDIVFELHEWLQKARRVLQDLEANAPYASGTIWAMRGIVKDLEATLETNGDNIDEGQYDFPAGGLPQSGTIGPTIEEIAKQGMDVYRLVNFDGQMRKAV